MQLNTCIPGLILDILTIRGAMKKILLIFIIVTIPVWVNAQFTGSGTSAVPYSGGTLTGNQTWLLTNSPIYVSGDLTVGTPSNAGHLTIEAGVTVRFCATGADLIITGLGELTADGTPSAQIRFTADTDKDGIYGETGEIWGHISFQSMGSAGASLFDNCIIEYGDVRGNSSPASYGGGIYADFSSITISNCKIQHNKAEWGGGIFVNENKSISINNSIIFDNFSKEAGGGIYCWNGSSSIIENTIFNSNHCDGTSTFYYTGGGFASQSNCSVSIYNCTFVNNTSSRTNGQSLMFYGSTNDKAVNCIFWGSGSHLYTSGTYITNYCAVQGSIPSGTGNFVLNSSNTAPDGPNFTAIDGSDWSIKVISPCRDAGTTPSPAVPNDYVGNPRVRGYDIGAYEVQYNYWLTSAGSTDWATGANWNGGVPTSSQNVVISTGATNYPTGSTSIDYTIGSVYGLVMEPGAKVTFNTLTKNGDLKLMSNSSAISSLITNNSVNAIVELYLTGGGSSSTYKWHYISSPVSALPVNTFILKPTMDFAQYFEARPTTNPLQGWIAYDGYIYYTGGYLTGSPYVITGTNLNVGQGYNYFYSSDYKFTFSGNINVSSVSPTITYGGNATLHGFNLLGNPFSSGLDWTTITNDAGYPTLTSKGLYFTRDNTQCSYISGVGYPDASVTGIIPPMQGFFIRTTNTSTTLPLLAGARAHNIPARYKGLFHLYAFNWIVIL
jgi:hypothetical protein